jgi:signal recognition particle subunit SEC65
MKGIQFLVDGAGRKTAVVIDLKKNPRLWEDFYDRVLAEERASEPRETLESVERRIARRRAHG